MTRVAAIDCGTNSIRLLIADVDPQAGTFVDVVRLMETVRLGEGVDRSGEFSDAALGRTFAACEAYATHLTEAGAESLRFVATSASRDVSNRATFVDGVHARLGIEPEVITGDEEAQLSFAGAVRSLGHDIGSGQALVVDIGGGSTEFVRGEVTTGVAAARSVDIGCVRMTERHLVADPPTAAQIAATISDVDAGVALADSAVNLAASQTLVGLAGSVTTVAALALGLAEYDSEAIHGSRISRADVDGVTERLLGMRRADRSQLGVMHPGRVDVIGGGALILSRIMAAGAFAEVLVSEHDILDGIAWSLV
ncbi:MAG: Ppx/GppA phosphatase family protein [Candidatus Nanopelagicales bacterium]